MEEKNENHETTRGSLDGNERVVQVGFQDDESYSPDTHNESSGTSGTSSTRRARNTSGSREARGPSNTRQALRRKTQCGQS